MKEPSSIQAELKRLPKLTVLGTALVQFASSLVNGHLVREGKRWVFRPANFVTFTIQHARAKSIVLSMSGNYRDFPKNPVLPLISGWNYNYSKCTITEPRQLAAAANCMERAFEIFAHRRKL